MKKGEKIKVTGLSMQEIMVLMADENGGNFYIERVGKDIYAVRE